MSADSRASPAPTILSIDDQPINQQLLTDCLEADGYRVVLAYNGEEGLRLAASMHPDAILLDVRMPGSIDGLEACRRLKADPATREIPVIFMTALAEVGDKLAAFAAGGVDYVTKPLEFDEVLARIRTHVSLYSLRRQLERQNLRLQEEIEARQKAQEAIERTNKELEQLAVERTYRSKAEGESATLRSLLEERDRMLGERDEMLRLLAHEVRQPLNNASAALENAYLAIRAQPGGEAAAVGKPLERARQVLDHVMGTLNNALAAATMLTSGATERMAEADVETLVALVVHDIDPSQRARVAVERTCGARTVSLQPVLMRLALRNLLSNALDYSPPGSPVRLRIYDSEEPLAIVFEVCDQGPGVAPELLAAATGRMALPPEGRSRSPAGAGLGLYIVRKVAELHGGSVEALRNTPNGSLVRLSIPQGLAL
jgi:signal transduction histidine kinase